MLNPIIPIMTSYFDNTNCIVISNTAYHYDYYPWRAFDDNLSEFSHYGKPSAPMQISYDLCVEATIYEYSITARLNYTGQSPNDWTFEGSHDGITWTIIDTITNQEWWGSRETRNYILSKPETYRYFKINVTAPSGEISVGQHQIYGDRQEVSDIIPIMSGYTNGNISVINSPCDYDNYTWKAFDGLTSTFYGKATSSLPLIYDLGEERCITHYVVGTRSGYMEQSPKNWTFEGSHDGINWTVIDNINNQINWASEEVRIYNLQSPQTYRYFKIFVTSSVNSGEIAIGTHQIYYTDQVSNLNKNKRRFLQII